MRLNPELQSALKVMELTDLEAQVYEYLLKNGPCGAAEIFKSLELDKSSVYRILENMQDEGLVISVGGVYGQEFMVNDVEDLIGKGEEKQREVKVACDKISEIVQSIEKNAASSYIKNNISVYTGLDAYLRVMEKRLEVKESPIREIANPTLVPEFYQEYWGYIEKYIKRRVNLKLELMSMVVFAGRGQKYERSSKRLLKEVRILPGGFKTNAMLSTFGDYTTINALKGDQVLGVVIKDKLITEVINSMYDIVWEQSERN